MVIQITPHDSFKHIYYDNGIKIVNEKLKDIYTLWENENIYTLVSGYHNERIGKKSQLKHTNTDILKKLKTFLSTKITSYKDFEKYIKQKYVLINQIKSKRDLDDILDNSHLLRDNFGKSRKSRKRKKSKAKKYMVSFN